MHDDSGDTGTTGDGTPEAAAIKGWSEMVGAVGAVMGPLTGGDPRRVGPYTTIGRLGAGALGPVYGGQADDGKVAAVRVLSPDLLADASVRAKLSEDLAAARTVAGPYAVPVLDLDLDAETPWTASALVAGVPLARAVAEHGPLPDPALLTLAGGIAEALAAVHAAGVMHGDLRPGTVLLTADGPRVVDYALARAFEGVAELGVAGYLAPEQALGRTVTPSADLFALGSTLFYAATGRPPFGEGTVKEIKVRVAKSSPVLGRLPEVLKELIRGCLQKDANSRAQPQQVLEYVQKRGATAWGRAWLPPAVAADVRAAVAETPGGGGSGTVVGAPAVGVVQLETDPAEHATVVAAVVTPVEPGAPAGPLMPGLRQPADVGVPFGGGGSAGHPPQLPRIPRVPASFRPAQAEPAAAPVAAPFSAPSRRNVLLALTGGAAVAVVGGTAAVGGLGGSSGTTPAAALPSPTAVPPGSGSRHPLPPTGALPPPAGAAGRLQGPAVTPFWELPVAGSVTSMAVGEGVLVVCGDSGVSGYDLGGNLLWGPVPAAGIPGSGNGVVASGVVYLIVAAGAGGDLLALNLKTGIQEWRTPLPTGALATARIGGALNGTVLVLATSPGPVSLLWAVEATRGGTRWLKNGVQFATLAVPSDGGQIVVAGAPGPDAVGAVAALDADSGDQTWARPLVTSVDYSTMSVSKTAFAGDVYVSLLIDPQEAGALVGGAGASGQTQWSTHLQEPQGDGGSLSLVTRSQDGTSVVAMSRHGIYAVDMSSGHVKWRSQGAESFNIASDSGAPQIVDGIVYLHDQKGSWWAVDLATGRTRWQYAVRGFDGAAEPVWIAASGGVVVYGGGKLAFVAAHSQ